jgi:hypothetical protein
MKSLILFLIAFLVTSQMKAQPFPAGGYQGGTHGNYLPVQQIQLFEGWSGTSGYINPQHPAMTTVLEMIGDELVILYSEYDVIWPGQNIWDIETWDCHSGYVIKVNANCGLELKGQEDENQSKVLHEGWNLIPVLCDQPILVEVLCAELDSLEVVSAVAGNGVYWPRYNINTLNYLWPGKSYWLFTYVPDVLDYGQPSSKSQQPYIFTQPEIFADNPWNTVYPTPLQHTVGVGEDAINMFSPGDIIGVFTESGLCAGVMVVGETLKAAGFSVFSNDPLSGEKDGFDEGEKLSFRFYSLKTGETSNLVPEYQSPGETGEFRDKGLTMISGFTVETTQISNIPQNNKIKIYPNPGNGIFTIEGVRSDDTVVIIDLHGETVYQKPGNIPGTINLSNLSPGIYFVKILTAQRQYHIKLVYQ